MLADDVGFVDDAGTTVLSGVDLEVRHGECVGIVGAAGVGKTLLLKLLHGIVRANRGEVWLLGERTQWLTHRALLTLWRRAAFLFDETALLSNLTIRANIELPVLYRRGLDSWAFRQRAEQLLEAFDLMQFVDARPGGLGLGIRTRAALVRALVVQPEILFGDDPFSGSDAQGRELVHSALVAAREQLGSAMVLTLADVKGGEGLCDRVLELHEGGRLTEVRA